MSALLTKLDASTGLPACLTGMITGATAATLQGGAMTLGPLPQVARMTMLCNAVSNVAVICNGCQDGLTFDFVGGGVPLGVLALSYAMNVADLLQEFAPSTE